MLTPVKDRIRSIPIIGAMALRLRQYQLMLLRRHPEKGRSLINVIESLPMYVPISGGTYVERAAMSVLVANEMIPALNRLASTLGLHAPQKLTVDDFVRSNSHLSHSGVLRELLIQQGSDKGSTHDYHRVYEVLLEPSDAVRAVLEIGLGTDYSATPENFGVEGKPGASLRAFRDYLPAAQIFGADIDRGALFAEDRIITHYVDQTDTTSLQELAAVVPDNLNLVIDDGLHAVHANLNTLTFGLSKVAVGGYVVIEDISPDSEGVWQTVGALLIAQGFECWYVKARRADMFIVRRVQ